MTSALNAGAVRLRRRLLRADDAGNAIVEFVVLAVLLMVPLVYVVLVVFRLQAAAYALASATRDAGRAFVTAPSSDSAHDRASAAAYVAMRDLGVPFDPSELAISCDPSCALAPGTTVDVRLATQVPLPLIPAALGGGRIAIGVSGEHLEYVDQYAVAR